jgi:hypothetical protein
VGPPSSEIGYRSPGLEIGHPSLELGRPSLEIGPTSLAIGCPSLELGPPSLELGLPHLCWKTGGRLRLRLRGMFSGPEATARISGRLAKFTNYANKFYVGAMCTKFVTKAVQMQQAGSKHIGPQRAKVSQGRIGTPTFRIKLMHFRTPTTHFLFGRTPLGMGGGGGGVASLVVLIWLAAPLKVVPPPLNRTNIFSCVCQCVCIAFRSGI